MSKGNNLGTLTVRVELDNQSGELHVEHRTSFSPHLSEMQAALAPIEKQTANVLRRAAFQAVADYFLYLNDPDRQRQAVSATEGRALAKQLARQNLMGLQCLQHMKSVAALACAEFARSDDTIVGELLLALAGRNKGYRKDTDRVHDFLEAVQADARGLPSLKAGKKSP